MITTNIPEVVSALNAMLARVHNMAPVMARIGEHQASKVLLEIMQEKTDPNDHRWAAWKPSTRASREKKGNAALGLLWDRGDLLASIKMKAGASEVAIGTDNPHAGYLQHGTSKMEARPFLGWSDEDMAYAERLVALHIEGLGL